MTGPSGVFGSGSPGRILFLIVLIDLVGFGIVLPLLPAQAAEFSASETAIGVLVASFSLMQFLFAPWWGRLSDRIGRRPVLLLGLAASAISYVLFALANGYWLLLLSRLLAGGIGATVNVAQAYLADVTPAKDRSRAMGMIGVAFGLGFIIGPAIAAATSRAGAVVPGLSAAAVCLLSLLLGWLRLPETVVHRPTRPSGPLPWRLVTAPYTAMLLSVIGFAVITVVFPLYTVQALDLGRRETSSFFVLMGVSSALVQAWLIGKVAPRLGERAMMSVGSLLLAAGLAAAPFCHSPAMPASLQLPAFLLALATLAAGTGLVWPAVAGYISRRTPPAEQGRALGVLHSVASLSRAIGPVVVGFIGEQGGFRAAFLGGAILALGAAIAGVLAKAIRDPL